MEQVEEKPVEGKKFEEGKLYKVVDGMLVMLQIDEADQDLRKIRVTEDIFKSIQDVQKRVRPLMKGYKPSLDVVAAGMLDFASKSPLVVDAVADFQRSLFA